MSYTKHIVSTVWVPIVLSVLLAGCDRELDLNYVAKSSPPSWLMGEFQDDYDITYSISDSLWHQLPLPPYRVQEWLENESAVLLRNQASDSSESTWLRIDWMQLEEMPPWEWAFCISRWDAAGREALFDDLNVNRAKPRSGCSGYPFSRMRTRIDSSSTTTPLYSP